MNVKNGEKISPYRAAQLSMYLGFSEDWAIYGALYNLAKSAPERAFWRKKWEQAYAREAETLLTEMEKISKSPAALQDPRLDGWD